MSLADARAADAALANYKPKPLTAEQIRQQARAKRQGTIARMTAAVARNVTMHGNVTRAALVSEGFTESEIDRHFRRALELADVAGAVEV